MRGVEVSGPCFRPSVTNIHCLEPAMVTSLRIMYTSNNLPNTSLIRASHLSVCVFVLYLPGSVTGRTAVTVMVRLTE